ncbi:MAG: Carbohydrate diacid regulator [bacterium ADurb.Bin400]|nr:MAG: Carbohydrate diacid regulator [bacterium ADurb.Bin400]
MSLTYLFGQHNQKHVANLVGKYAVISSTDGVCVASSNHRQVGQKIDLPKNLFKNKNSQIIKLGDQFHLALSLKYRDRRIATLLLENYSEQTKQYSPLLISLAELSISQYFNHIQTNVDSTDQFILRIISDDEPNIKELKAKSKILGINPDTPRVGILINLQGFLEKSLTLSPNPSSERDDIIRKWKRRIESILNGFFTSGNDIITAYIGEDRFLVLKAVSSESEEVRLGIRLQQSFNAIFGPLTDAGATPVNVGFGHSHSGISGITDSYKQARMALELGRKLHPGRSIYYFGDLGILPILAENRNVKKIAYADQLLEQLSSGDLYRTLEVFLQQGLNLAEAARVLGIHRNTAIYRLNQITSLLGLDPRKFEDAVMIKIALMVKHYL